MLPPPHSLHWLLMRLCWQMPSPPQSLHWFLIRLCWQMPAPPHSLNWLLIRACWQMLAPPHSLRSRRTLWKRVTARVGEPHALPVGQVKSVQQRCRDAISDQLRGGACRAKCQN